MCKCRGPRVCSRENKIFICSPNIISFTSREVFVKQREEYSEGNIFTPPMSYSIVRLRYRNTQQISNRQMFGENAGKETARTYLAIQQLPYRFNRSCAKSPILTGQNLIKGYRLSIKDNRVKRRCVNGRLFNEVAVHGCKRQYRRKFAGYVIPRRGVLNVFSFIQSRQCRLVKLTAMYLYMLSPTYIPSLISFAVIRAAYLMHLETDLCIRNSLLTLIVVVQAA